jgi:hypothetical protein
VSFDIVLLARQTVQCLLILHGGCCNKNKIRVFTTVKAGVVTIFRPFRTFPSNAPRFPVTERFAVFARYFNDRDEPQLYLKLQLVPRCKHSPSRL